MSEVKWTQEQLQAIEEKGSNILVAAAAGSGKTAVLVERIIHKIIDEKMDIDKMLVVTFTNAAASEMRERILEAIYKKLEQEPSNVHLQRQLMLLNKASICTIHSFCLDVIHNHFYELDLPSNFRIADTTEIDLLKQEVLEDLLEQKYIENNQDFIELLETYTSYRGDEPLQDLILAIYRFIQSSPYPEKWLQEKVEMFSNDAMELEKANKQCNMIEENRKENKEEDITKLCKLSFEDTIWGKVILQEVTEEIENCILKLQKVETELAKWVELMKFHQVICEDILKLQAILEKTNSWDTTFIELQNFKFSNWPIDKKVTLEQKEEAKQIRDEVRKAIKEKVATLIQVDSTQIQKDFQTLYPILVKLKNIVLEFSQNFAEKKKEKNCIDFNDIEHFALKILLTPEGEKTVVAKKYTEKFEEIAIDEYQDSNLVQEAILTSISKGNNIFMVGDVKQSIYKFRQARPELFLYKYETYQSKENKQENQDLKIQLFRNFRSRENVLDITNLVFEAIMSPKIGDIQYNENEYLNLGANFPEIGQQQVEQELIDKKEKSEQDILNQNKASEQKLLNQSEKTEQKLLQQSENKATQNLQGNSPIAELDIIDMKENDSVTAFLEENVDTTEEEEEQERIEDDVLEARFVAKRIQELINNKYLIYDKKIGYRPIKPKDIVILLRATSHLAPIYEKELSERELPVFSDTSSSYLDSTEIQTILSVLKIIDNPMQDIPLVVVLRSVIGDLTDNELITIRLTDKNCNFYEALLKARMSSEETLKEKIENLLIKLEKWKKQSEYLPLEELIWQIYLDTDYYQYVGLLPNGAMRQANLKTLFEKAKEYETASFKGLFHFIQFIEKLKKQNGDFASSKLIGENEDVIRIMSIHKSKGLEFPVVFLCNTHKKFNFTDLNDVILLHQDLGFGPTLIDSEKKIKYPTVAKQAISIKVKQETLSEEERILYVALTRAKEKLIITGRRKDFTKLLQKKEQILSMYPMKEDFKIDSKIIKKCTSYLDWLEYVYLFHKDRKISLKGKELKIEDIIKMNSYLKQDLLKELQKPETEEKENILKKIEKEVQKQTKEKNQFEVQNQIKETNQSEEKLENKKEMQDGQNTIQQPYTIEDLKQILKWKYKYEIDTKLPTKTSVSKLKQENQGELISINSRIDWEETEGNKTTVDEEERNEEIVEDLEIQTKDYAYTVFTEKQEIQTVEEAEKKKQSRNIKTNLRELVPQFIKEKQIITPAQRGTLVHLCIQKLKENKNYTKEDIQKLVSSLVEKQIITLEEANAIPIDLIYHYTQSELFKELKTAKEIHKEQPFYMNIPATEIFKEAKEEHSEKKILVQGVIDLYYITQQDEIKLVDFKTDYVPKGKEQEIAQKYQIQLDIYQNALEQALGKKVSSSKIFFLGS